MQINLTCPIISTKDDDRGGLPEPANPLGLDGIEFLEYATSRPYEFGALLHKLGFTAVARHRSREVVQLIEPAPDVEDSRWDEGLVRLGLGAADVPAATRALKERGVVFIERGAVQPSEKGALTQVYLGGVTFELVVSHLAP